MCAVAGRSNGSIYRIFPFCLFLPLHGTLTTAIFGVKERRLGKSRQDPELAYKKGHIKAK